MENSAFIDQNSSYYTNEKSIMHSYIKKGPNIVFDIGCGSGNLGKKLFKLGKAAEIIGVEIFKPAADKASEIYTKVYNRDIETINLNYKEYFDYIICGDILEHLKNPELMIKKILRWLKCGASFIATVPNIRYWRILKDLLFFGKWVYTDAGILDKTHLRFFTKNSFLKLLPKSDFYINHVEVLVHGRKKILLNNITVSIFEEFLGSQIFVVARKINRNNNER